MSPLRAFRARDSIMAALGDPTAVSSALRHRRLGRSDCGAKRGTQAYGVLADPCHSKCTPALQRCGRDVTVYVTKGMPRLAVRPPTSPEDAALTLRPAGENLPRRRRRDGLASACLPVEQLLGGGSGGV